MFDKLHSYLKYFIFFTAISLLFALPVFADSTKKRTRNTPQNQNQNSEVKLTKFDSTVAYNIWNEYYLAQEQGVDFPLPVFKPNADPESVKQLMAMWNEGKQKAYKESVRRFQKKSKANQLPQETNSNQNSNTKALTKFDVNVAYKIWNDYYLTQEQGINPYPPKFESLNTNEQEAKKLIAIWNKGKQKAEKEALKRREDARTGKTSFQPQPVIPLPGSNQIPVSQTNNPYLNTPNHLKHFSKPTTIAGVFSQTTNSAYTDSVKLLNHSNSIALNNNKALAKLNTKNISYNIAKAKELANIAYPLVDNPGVTTEYLIDPNNITGLPQVVEELQNGQVIRQYTYGADGIISMRQRINNEWVVSFFIKDGHGSVRMLTDVNGNITDTYDYDAFGNLVAKTGNTPNSRLYAGEEFDEDLGFYYLRARFLDTVKGRFLTQDTFEESLFSTNNRHKYTYVSNNPINTVDPTGHFGISQAATGFSLINTLAGASTLNLGRTIAAFQDTSQIETLRLNIVYENTSQGGTRIKYSDTEKQDIINNFAYFANFGFGNIDIKFRITETDGEAENLYNPSRTIRTGYLDGALNAFFTKRGDPSKSPGVTTDNGTFINSKSDVKNLLHELTHQLGIRTDKNGYTEFTAEFGFNGAIAVERALLAGRQDYTLPPLSNNIFYKLRLWGAEKYAVPPTTPNR